MALFRGKKTTPDQEVDPPTSVPSDSVPTDTVPLYTPDTPPPVVTRPAGRSPLVPILGGLSALALAGLGLFAYSKMSATPTDENSPTSSPMGRKHKPATPAAHQVKSPQVKLPLAGQTTATGTPKTPAKVRTVPVAALGIAPNGVKGPVMAPAVPGGVARMVPVHGAPTPIHAPPGMAAHPGKTGSPNPAPIGRPVHAPPPIPPRAGKSAASPQIATQLSSLWQKGADAKHRNNYKAARRAWQAALKLAPGHAGFQDAINKLPS